ncbi:Ubiquinone/menaquinone biosynthesis C-methylase UbiE [Rhizobiales bacterium GAS191]|nr:Ubiquinone/menaquinone biosynthesis C-methylase UbiE [Rhizobiales bacterium GAS191]
MDIASKPPKKAHRGLAMEGMLATWYAKNTANDLPEFEACARRIAEHLGAGSHVLEIAPGPGYLAIALAKLGPYRIAGLDISRSFVRMAADNAARAGVEVEFRYGDAAAIPDPAETFDFIVCRAAFKNFADPVGALREMHRVLRPGGKALIIDMRNDASNEAIDDKVDEMKLGRVSSFITRAIFKYSLRKRAYSRADFQRMAAATPFGSADIREEPLGFDVSLRKCEQR